MSEKENKVMICISCPIGCQLNVEVVEKTAMKVEGYTCKKGKKYAEQEVSDPRRMLTTTVSISGGLWSRIPVRSASAVPKDLVMKICRDLHRIQLQSPVKMGTVVLENAGETGISILAARSM